ncbi:MAG: hypothetical protein ACRDH6_07545 [Actinomycetota bacterium]
MASRITPEPSHEPVGFSDEAFPVSRRFVTLFLTALAVAVAGALVALLNY